MTIPFLIDFTPYKFSGEICQSIDDMVSIGLQQKFNISTVDYDIGSNDDVNIPVSVKNITNNTRLEVTITFNKNMFVVDVDQNIDTITITLEPNQTRIFTFFLNKQMLDQTVGMFDTNISVKIRNLTNGGLITRNVSVTPLEVKFLDTQL